MFRRCRSGKGYADFLQHGDILQSVRLISLHRKVVKHPSVSGEGLLCLRHHPIGFSETDDGQNSTSGIKF